MLIDILGGFSAVPEGFRNTKPFDVSVRIGVLNPLGTFEHCLSKKKATQILSLIIIVLNSITAVQK